jgi:NADPH:quinone reductase-like Zn-dependent oxidoreductase
LFFLVEPSRTQLNELSRLVDAGAIRTVVDAILPLSQAREAYERGINGHPRGKLVLAVVADDAGPSAARDA